MEQLDDDQDWELINDDGFVYKRLKRLRLHPSTSAAPPDPAIEELNRNKRRKKTLSKLKSKYQKEIHHWELLSNTLKALQNRTLTQPPPQPQPLPATTRSPDLCTDLSIDSTFRDLTDTLLIQVEAQEASIVQISTLCDVAEALCNAQEQVLKQPFVYLPIWELSPRKLITSLCEE
ncbi:hypothetical protein OSB04_000168 [Centaurea solstitialis]|uniref:Uncharacterized protein n=1 Tax=Centaurea solstitialis TaxID=347529 RepID=A0AA38WKF1_9ASTR|nr:hypothetical protein OSB04_000168 [Centaurea solstitialis]